MSIDNRYKSIGLVNKDIPISNVKSVQYGTESFYENGKCSKRIIEPQLFKTPTFDEYCHGDKFRNLRALLGENSGQKILGIVESSGLTGCGGAHFPVAIKWKAALKFPGPRYLAVNCQEGEPYTFKDYSILKKYPEILLEGALIAGLAVEAEEIFIIVNSAYSNELVQLNKILAELKVNIGRLPFEVNVIPGPNPDLYICGEESALIQFLENKRGEPQLRPPFPFEKGYKNCPTIIQNAETVSWIPLVVENPEIFKPGGNIHLVNIWGDVAEPGIREVRIGTSFNELLNMAGGLCAGSTLKAIEVGGLAGGLFPPQHIELNFEHQGVRNAGGLVGTGSVRFLNQERDLIQEAVNAMTFFRDESCGRCTPCRVGTQLLVSEAESLLENHDKQVLTHIDEISTTMMNTSICGLGKGASTQLLSLLRYWDIQNGNTTIKP